MSDSSRPHGLQPIRLLRQWDFPGKSTGVGCHCLLQEQTLGSIKQNTHKGNHMNTSPNHQQHPVQDASSKNQTKQNTNHQQTGLPPHSAFPIRGKTNKQKMTTNLTLYEAYTNYWMNLRRAETKRKKEFNLLQGNNSTFLEVWEKETSNKIS